MTETRKKVESLNRETKKELLTAGNTALNVSGIDLASGADIERHGVFFPTAVTLLKMHDYIAELYAKGDAEQTDALIEVYDEADTKLFGRTVTAAGEAAKLHTQTAPEAGEAVLAAGTGIYIKATNTETSGTGHAVVMIEYVDN
jgi:hypothetical protein